MCRPSSSEIGFLYSDNRLIYRTPQPPGIAVSCQLPQGRGLCYEISVRRLSALPQASFRPRLATTPLLQVSDSSVVYSQGTSTPSVSAHPGRTRLP